LHALREKYKALKIAGATVDSYLGALTGYSLTHVSLRSRLGDSKNPLIPYTGCCVPGARFAVNVDGEINICERVNGTYPIGHIDKGLDYGRIAHLVQEYQKKILYKCANCPLTRLCGLCFKGAETAGGISEPRGYCEIALQNAKKNLGDYISILEINSNADIDLRTDVVELQRNLLFNS
jgi:uncharacterized protein